MNTSISRTQFLRGDFSGKSIPLRPPWALHEPLFTETCTACGECISHCPAGIIEQGRANYPVVNFDNGECDFCGICVEHCTPGALKRINGNAAWSLKATIDAHRCLAYNNVECRSCYDPCETQAIQLTLRAGAVALLAIDTDRCSGCGACITLCPTKAISIQHQETNA